MLFGDVLLLGVAGDSSFEPFASLVKCSTLIKILTLKSQVLSVNDVFHGFCVVNPFESAKSVCDRYDVKGLYV